MSTPHKDQPAPTQEQPALPLLDEELIVLWHREFDRFPPGHFIEADKPSMAP